MRAALRSIAFRLGWPRRYSRVRWRTKSEIIKVYDPSPRERLRYVLLDPELDNFTYELANEDELVDWVAGSFDADRARVGELLREAHANPAIHDRLRAATRRRFSMKTSPPLGRRLGWYVIARLTRPSRIVETGIHDGIGSLVLLAALERNAAEGAEGDLVSFDVNPAAGWMVGTHPRWTPRFESSTDGLEAVMAQAPVGLFLHDSLHTYEHEHFELATAAKYMRGSVLLSDNSHATTALRDVCADVGAEYSFFRERPRDHFYPGAGIGLGLLPGLG